MAEHKIITNLESKDIYVFPAGLRGSNYNKSKFTTEDNLILFNKISANNKNLNRVYLNPFGEGLIIKIAGYCFTIMPEILEDQFPDIQEFEDSNLYALITLVDKGDGIGKVLANVNPSVASGVAPEMAGDYIYTLDSQEGTFYKFLGLVFVDDNGLADIINNSYYKNNFSDDEYQVEYLKIKESGSLRFLTQKLALDASEIRNTENSDESLSEALNTDTLRVNTITAKTSNPIQFNSRNYFGNMDVNFSGSTGSSVNISKNVTIASNTTLGAASTGGITIKSGGSGNTTIIGPSGGTINLPANYSGAGTTNAVLAQTGSSATSRWLNYDKANTANTLVLRDNNNINATTFNNVYVTKGTNSFKIWAGGSTVDASTTKAYIKMNGKLTVASGVAATLNSNISIAASSPVDIDVPFNVGADGKTGGVNISSSANKVTTIIGPSDGTTILPDSNVVPQAAATGYKYIWAQHHDKDSGVYTNSWIPVSALADQPNAIVMTDADGKVHATIEGLIDEADKVLQKVNTTDKDYRLAFTTLTAENHESLAHTSGITVNPSTKTITATNFAGRASESTKVKVAQDTTNTNYRILFSPTTTTGSYVEIKYTNSSLYVNPNTGVLGATELKSTTITNTGAISSDTVSATTSMTAPIFIGDLRGNADTATQFKDDTTVQLSGDVLGSATSKRGWSITATLANSGVTAGSYGLSANATPGFGSTFNVPYFTVNSKGLITGASTKTAKIPATIAKYDTLGLVKPAYSSTGEASFTTAAATNTSTPTISEKTTTSGRYYGIEADKNGRLFVNVPWVNTTYDASAGITLDGTTFKHSHTLTAKSAANNAATATPGFGSTITTYETLYNTYGHVTGISPCTVTIPATVASSSNLGLVKIGYSESGKNYAVKLSSDKMYVKVPWTDTLTTAGRVNKSSTKLFLTGVENQISDTDTAESATTYTNSNTYIGSDNNLYSNGVQVVNLSASQALTNKTYNGYTLAAACAKGVTDSSSAGALGTGTNLVTERDVYYGTPIINNSKSYTSSTTIYAPTAGGTSNYILIGKGTTTAPGWTQYLSVSQGGTGATTLTSGQVLIGNGTSAVTTRAITNNTSATAVTAGTNLITANTLYYHTGNSNITTLGTITTGTWQGSTISASYLPTASTSAKGVMKVGTGLSVSSGKVSLSASGVSANSYGPGTGGDLGHNSEFIVPNFTVDTYGRLTAAGYIKYKLPGSGNTDKYVNQKPTNDTNTSARPLLLGHSYSDESTPVFSEVTNIAYAAHNVYVKPKDGSLHATSFVGKGSSLTKLNASNISSGTLSKDRLPTSGVTASSYGPDGNKSPSHGGTFSVPYITVDKYGRVTSASSKTITLPTITDSDKKVTQSLKEDGNNYYLILKNTNNATNETAGVNYSKNVYVTPSSGRLTAQSFNALSDARRKENFQPLNLNGKSILDLPVYKFDFKDGSLKNQIGCKAQDLQEICPEIVSENSEGFLSIQESKIVYLLLEEVKQLKAEIETLKNK